MNPSMPLLQWTSLLLVALASVLADAGPLPGQTRRARTSPGLVMETGAPRAFTDALVFTADGKRLLAAGEDKVVRYWDLDDEKFASPHSRVLRWPIYREQRGSIFALTPLDGNADRLAIAGFGNPTNLLAVLDRQTGRIEEALTDPKAAGVTWKITVSPDGKQLIFGQEDGGLYRWRLGAGEKAAVRFAGTGGKPENRPRLLSFLDDRFFVSVSRLDGRVLLHDVQQPQRLPRHLGGFQVVKNLYRVALSPNKRWLAASGERVNDTDAQPNKLELLELLPGGTSGWTARPSRIYPFASPKGDPQAASFVRVVAFSPDSTRLAVGLWIAPEATTDAGIFTPPTSSIVHVFKVLAGGALERTTKGGLRTAFLVEQITFRPDHPDQLASAGGANHELRLWDLRREKVLDEVNGPGSCIWQVAMSKDGKYLAWKEQMNLRPSHPNDRATGPWRVFPLRDESRKVLNKAPEGFVPLTALNEHRGWRVETTLSDWLWTIHGPNGTRVDLDSSLYFSVENQIPQCFTFIPASGKRPVRLAVGHQWGVSLYDLRPGNVRLTRMLTGHEGKVMTVAPSPDGKLLFSAGRDQAIACWSLEEWPSGSELGASFAITEEGRLRVRSVDPGSPAWEAGLTDEDEIDTLGAYDREQITGRLFDPGKRLMENPATGLSSGTIPHRGGQTPMFMRVRQRLSAEEAAEALRTAAPQKEYVLVWRHGLKQQSAKTTLRVRPLWRFFPTRADQGNDWVLWRWRDFYYDTNSANADRYLGWHVNAEEITATPRFYPLANFSGRGLRQEGKARPVGFHNPAKVWRTVLDTFQAPEKVLFPDIEPPMVALTVVQPARKGADGKWQPLQLRVRARPRDDDQAGQKIARVSLWVNDTLVETPLPLAADGTLDQPVSIPKADLAHGLNTLTLTCFNAQGGRGDDRREVTLEDDTLPTRTLYAVCVGNNDYSQIRNSEIGNLTCSEADAVAISKVLGEHANSRLFDRAEVVTLTGKQVTAARLREQIRRLGEKAHPNDLFVLFLSGHGDARKSVQARGEYEQGTFYYICVDSDLAKPDTTLTARELHDLLASVRGRKLLLLDACHSGAVGSNPVKDANDGQMPFLILSACKPNQQAIEPGKDALVRGVQSHGLFTQGILNAVVSSEQAKGARRLQPVTANYVGTVVRNQISELLQVLSQAGDLQVPEFSPPDLPRRPLLCRP